MAYQSFEDLKVWQRGCALSVEIFKAFASCKNFTLKDQIGRASLSIPCNIAEGSERGSVKDFAHFLNFSKGSCAEVRTQVYIARKLELLGKDSFDRFVAETKEISKMLEGLRRSMLAKSRAKQKRLHRKTVDTLNSRTDVANLPARKIKAPQHFIDGIDNASQLLVLSYP